MSTLTITIELGNDAMKSGYDAYQAIAKSSIPHNRGEDAEGDISDENGNSVGSWKIAVHGFCAECGTTENLIAEGDTEICRSCKAVIEAEELEAHADGAHEFVEMIDGTCYYCEKKLSE
jgi:hypothetical protein